jgi:hypothetical protein
MLTCKKKRVKKPLFDYSQSHVMTFIEYSNILCHKALDKKIAKEIRQQKWMEREDKKAKQAIDFLNAIKKVIQMLAKKHA